MDVSMETRRKRAKDHEYSKCLREARKLRRMVRAVKGKQGAWLTLGSFLEHMDEVVRRLQESVPKITCPECEGEGCGWCRNSGVMPAWQYENWRIREEEDGFSI